MGPASKPSSFPPEIAGGALRRASKPSSCTILLLLLLSLAFFLYLSLTFPPQFSTNYVPALSPAGDRRTPTNTSHIVFAIGGSAKTWRRLRGYCGLWWRPGTMRGHVWLDVAPAEWPDACPPWRVSSTRAARPAERLARIAAESYGEGLEGARWFVMGDDDTVFFPENVAAVLGKYDHEEMYYVGAPSESAGQDERHSYGMAFGGGGFAVSFPAAAALAGVIDGCLLRYAKLYGSDERVHACFSDLGVPLTREPGFHQMDVSGDIYGMLAAHPVAPLLSLHHLNKFPPISPLFQSQLDAVGSLVAVAGADPSRTLQQSFCHVRSREHTWTVSVAWGYTAQIYPWVLAPKELEVPLQTFKTWRTLEDGPFTFNTRAVGRPDRPCERPVRFFFKAVQAVGNGTVTEYGRYGWGDDGNVTCDSPGFAAAARVERVTVQAATMDPTIWQKAPRRQCCEAKRRGPEDIDVHIRNCRPAELTLPL